MHFSWDTKRIQHHELRPFRQSLYYECVCYILGSLYLVYLLSHSPKIIDDGARGIVEMLFCTSLIALVGAADQPSSSPRKLQIVNTKVRRYYQSFAIVSFNPLRRSGNL